MLDDIILKYKHLDNKSSSPIIKLINYNLELKNELIKRTEFLDEYFFLDDKYKKIETRIRLYFLWNDIKNVEFCQYCNNIKKIYTKFSFFNTNDFYYDHCGNKNCIKLYNTKKSQDGVFKKYNVSSYFKTDEFKEKNKRINLEKYGGNAPACSKEIQEKIKQTCLKKYGVDNPLKSKEIQEKIKQTCLKKYGGPSPISSNKIKEKIKNKLINVYKNQDKKDKIFYNRINYCLEKYGTEYTLQNKDIREKIKQTNLEKYGVDNPWKSNKIREKIKQTNLEKYGVEHPMQNDFFLKSIMNKWFQYKDYILPSGKLIKIQGYENKFLDEYFKNGYTEENICINYSDIKEKIGIIWYNTDDGKKHRYFPDFYLINENKIIEVKSYWTYEKQKEINELKKIACLNKGLNFEFKIF